MSWAPKGFRGRIEFALGAAVIIQREVGAAWESASYVEVIADMKGWHRVLLSPTAAPHVVTLPGGGTVGVRSIIVPTQRLRYPSEGTGSRRGRR